MARRALARQQAVAHGADTAVYEEAGLAGSTLEGPTALDPSGYPPEPLGSSRARRGRRSGSGSGSGGGGWRGSGGRWWIWVGRAVLWALILVILVNGVRAPFERLTEDSNGTPSAPAAAAQTKFPVDKASAFALQFGNVYLNYNQQTALERERQLESFVPEGSGQFGWNVVGALRVQSIQVAGVDVRDDNNAVVTLLARDNVKWFSLAVPIYASGGGMVVSAKPALLPPPARATLPQPPARERDTALEETLRQTFEGFFPGYAKSDPALLSGFTDGAITGLGGAVTFVRLNDIVAPRGAADRRTVTADVTWQVNSDPQGVGGELDQTYELDVVQKNGKWYVRQISAATQPATS